MLRIGGTDVGLRFAYPTYALNRKPATSGGLFLRPARHAFFHPAHDFIVRHRGTRVSLTPLQLGVYPGGMFRLLFHCLELGNDGI
jgi:hypothetical protein